MIRRGGCDRLFFKIEYRGHRVFYRLLHSINDNTEYGKMSSVCNPYGDIRACERIADILEGKEYQAWESNQSN